jgi:hypothetical protein
MAKTVLIFVTLFLICCITPDTQAAGQMHIDSIEPSVIHAGGEFLLRGGDFGCNDGSYTVETRVRLQRRGAFDLDAPGVYLGLSVILDDQLRAHVPREVAAGQYTIFVITFSASGRLLCRSNPVTLTIRQPSPPAVAADPNQVIENPCSRRDPTDAASAARFTLPGMGRSSPRTCRYPLKTMRILSKAGSVTAHPADPITVSVSGVAEHDQEMVIAILRAEQIPGEADRYRYLIKGLMTTEVRTGAPLAVRIPSHLKPGAYKIAGLYRLQTWSVDELRDNPFRFMGRRPLYVMGTNTIEVKVTDPRPR